MCDDYPEARADGSAALERGLEHLWEHLGIAVAVFDAQRACTYCSDILCRFCGHPETLDAFLAHIGFVDDRNSAPVRSICSNKRHLRVELGPGTPGVRPALLEVLRHGPNRGELTLLFDLAGRAGDSPDDHVSKTGTEQMSRLASLGQIAAGVAHEFNNIMTSVIGWTQIARQSTHNKVSLVTALEIIEGNVKRAKELSTRLLDNSRGAATTTRSLVALRDQLEDVLQLLSWEMDKAQIRVVRRFDDVPSVEADAGELGQVFINLLRNAMDAMPGGGTLHIELAQRGDQNIVTFTDTGQGMPPEVLEKIFEPFYTTKTSDGEKRGGTGLGLATSSDIVRSHGGHLGVESAPERGTRFVLRLPVAKKPAPGAEPVGASSLQPGTDKKRPTIPQGIKVLVVDDEPDIGEMVMTALSIKGADVVCAESGEEALHRCRGQLFHAAFIDYTMPGLSGSHLAREILSVQPDLKLIVMSGHVLDLGKIAPVADFLKKPFDLDDIQTKLREALCAPND